MVVKLFRQAYLQTFLPSLIFLHEWPYTMQRYFAFEIANSNTSLVVQGLLAHRLQCHTASKTQNCRQGVPKRPTVSGLSLGVGCSNQLVINQALPLTGTDCNTTAYTNSKSNDSYFSLREGLKKRSTLPFWLNLVLPPTPKKERKKEWVLFSRGCVEGTGHNIFISNNLLPVLEHLDCL